jgi:hypothetical protein
MKILKFVSLALAISALSAIGTAPAFAQAGGPNVTAPNTVNGAKSNMDAMKKNTEEERRRLQEEEAKKKAAQGQVNNSGK